MPEELLPLLQVSGAWVRGCLDAARGVLVLSDAREFGGVVAAERSAWEMWREVDYLLNQDDPAKDAVKVQAAALIDVISQLEKLDDVPEGMLDRNKEALQELEVKYPDVLADVREQRKKGRYHWSGKSRTSVIGPTDASKAVYKMLSWEAHPDVCGIRDISADLVEGTGVLTVSPYNLSDASMDRPAVNTSECLLRAWNVFARYWMQPTIDDAPPRSA